MHTYITNRDELATSRGCSDALSIAEAGLQSLNTEKIIKERVLIKDSNICIDDVSIDTAEYERIIVVGIGKCANDACKALEDILGDKISEGIVLDIEKATFQRLSGREGTHPMPSPQNVVVANDIVTLLQNTTEKDLVITVVSGGGSALLCLPHDINCEEEVRITEALMHKGATIQELNTVRKHISQVKGGYLAQYAYPARVVSLIFSDVPGDDISVVASGPTVLDETTVENAAEILTRYDVLRTCLLENCNLIETPKESKYFENVDNILLVSNMIVLSAMTEKALSLGYAPQIKSNNLQGAVSDAVKKIAQDVKDVSDKKSCLLYGGEVSVEVMNKEGRGGRNQEMGLYMLDYIQNGDVFVALATDGRDNSDVAGVCIDSETKKVVEEKEIDISYYKENSISYDFFKETGGHITTGITGSNVSDIYFTLSSRGE